MGRSAGVLGPWFLTLHFPKRGIAEQTPWSFSMYNVGNPLCKWTPDRTNTTMDPSNQASSSTTRQETALRPNRAFFLCNREREEA